jgi:phenylalanyl-tRNA synthetase beta chain
MRVPLGWLKEYVTWNMPVADLAHRLTLGGLEVSATERIGEDWDESRIFVGQVLSVRPHPDADRLVLVTVEYGAEAPLEVVTGAPNLRVGEQGQKVVFATVGARLIDGYAETRQYKTLKRSKIRGVNSEGMVCSEKELGISDEHAGILILPKDAPVGMPLARYWGDTVLDIELTPNLARCFSMVGVAREVAALTGGVALIGGPQLAREGEPIAGQIDIIIQDPDLCPRYSAALIKGIQIGPSPQWMQRRLSLAGMRPINNIVDITNYVMLEWGQPLHAFDYRLVRPAKAGGPPTIIVRRAHEGEQMETLDGEKRIFSSEMLLITDGGGPVAVAGVMGGLESEVTAETVDILLESANFDNISVRRTSAALHIPSEAAQRFGRGVDPELTLVALRRAADLMRTLAGGAVAAGFADAYPRPFQMRLIDLKLSEIERQLGIGLDAQRVIEMLGRLGFHCEVLACEAETLRVTVPSSRLDVSISADLVEELARLYGYDRLPTTLIREEMPTQGRNLDLEAEERVRDALVGCGLTEIISYSLTNLESVALLDPARALPEAEGYLRVANPLTREQQYLRQTLLNTTLETMARNLRFIDRVTLFEIANVYLPHQGRTLPDEPRRLSVGLCGPQAARSWLTNASAAFDFYDLKGIVETLCARMDVADVQFAPMQHPTFHPGRVASVSVGVEQIGVLGEVHPLVRAAFDLPEQPVCLLELDLEQLLAAATAGQRFRPLSRMPALKLDLAVMVGAEAPADALEAAIRQAGGSWLVDVVLFDVYHGEQVGERKKSLAYSLTFQAPDRTLTSEQANKQRDGIVQALQQQFGAEIRG